MIFFDVGANDGREYLDEARNGNTVYAFEPIPRLAKTIRETVDREKLTAYHIFEKAVSDVAGIARFYIAGTGDWGCSSLNEFSDDLDVTWPEQANSVVTETIDVEVIRMDDFVTENKIDRIDYLNVDVQGSDLRVLRSFGDKIGIVQEGRIEVANLAHLYKETPTKQECIEFLKSHGFEIWKIVPNDYLIKEENVFFRRLG